jgi:hypothetical protein
MGVMYVDNHDISLYVGYPHKVYVSHMKPSQQGTATVIFINIVPAAM